jgi:hypothetical protein
MMSAAHQFPNSNSPTPAEARPRLRTIYSSNSSPDCLHASQPRIDQLEYARLPMISLNKLFSYEVAASRTAVRNSAIPLPVSLDVVNIDGCAAGCLAASVAVIS